MNYVQFHIGDWESGTRLLTPLEKGIYIDLLMLYYSTERPILRSYFDRITRGYTEDERKAFDYVVSQYFEEQDDGFHNARCDEEIAKAAEKSEKARKSIQARWNKAAKDSATSASETRSKSGESTDAKRTNNERNTDVLLTNNQEPITNKETERKKKEKPQAITHAFNLDTLPEDWRTFCEQLRPDLNPDTVFASFSGYYRIGKGKDTMRSGKGWNQSWLNWVKREKEITSRKPAGSNAHQQPEVFDEAYYEGSMNPDGTANWG